MKKTGRKDMGDYLVRLHITPKHEALLTKIKQRGGATMANSVRVCIEIAKDAIEEKRVDIREYAERVKENIRNGNM